MKRAVFAMAAAAGLVAAMGCGTSHGSGHHKSLLAELREAEAGVPEHGVSVAPMLAGETLVKVEGVEKAPEFFVRSREGKVSKAPCQQCHKIPLERMKHDGKDGRAKAHWSVELKHAGEAVMNCRTCHQEGDLNRLRTLNNRSVAFDHSYRVCAQCHSKQASDWAGGSHGKRVAGWAPPRVASTCVDCHNPHQPAWDVRWPAYAARAKE